MVDCGPAEHLGAVSGVIRTASPRIARLRWRGLGAIAVGVLRPVRVRMLGLPGRALGPSFVAPRSRVGGHHGQSVHGGQTTNPDVAASRAVTDTVVSRRWHLAVSCDRG